jgi:hypothetical protein
MAAVLGETGRRKHPLGPVPGRGWSGQAGEELEEETMSYASWVRTDSGPWHRVASVRVVGKELHAVAACGWQSVVKNEDVVDGTEAGPDGVKVANVCAYCQRRSHENT